MQEENSFGEIYFKEETLKLESVFEWAKIFFIIKGYEFSEFEKPENNDFADLNPLYRMLVEAGKKIVEEEEKEKNCN